LLDSVKIDETLDVELCLNFTGIDPLFFVFNTPLLSYADVNFLPIILYENSAKVL